MHSRWGEEVVFSLFFFFFLFFAFVVCFVETVVKKKKSKGWIVQSNEHTQAKCMPWWA